MICAISGLTWSASTGASVPETMRCGGHSSPAAARRYQHATRDRDRELAGALADMAPPSAVVSLLAAQSPADEMRTKLAPEDEADATVTRLTSHNTEQSQRGSNPCLHLERASRFVASGPGR